MLDYTSIAETALDQIRDSGMSMYVRRTSNPGTYDPSTGQYKDGEGAPTVNSTADYICKGLIVSQTFTSGQAGQRFFNGAAVLADDQFILLAASGMAVVPKSGDFLVVGSTIYNVVTLMTIQPGGVPLLYKILARR